MAVSFLPNAVRLVAPVVIVGPRRNHEFKFTLDTGRAVTVAPATYLR